MSSDLQNLVTMYMRELMTLGREPIRMNIRLPIRDVPPITFENHLLWMCEHIERALIPAGQIEKAQRWLGFIQCGLSYLGKYSIDDLRSHDTVKVIP